MRRYWAVAVVLVLALPLLLYGSLGRRSEYDDAFTAEIRGRLSHPPRSVAEARVQFFDCEALQSGHPLRILCGERAQEIAQMILADESVGTWVKCGDAKKAMALAGRRLDDPRCGQ